MVKQQVTSGSYATDHTSLRGLASRTRESQDRCSPVAADAVAERHDCVELPRVAVIEAEHVAQQARAEQCRELRARQMGKLRHALAANSCDLVRLKPQTRPRLQASSCTDSACGLLPTNRRGSKRNTRKEAVRSHPVAMPSAAVKHSSMSAWRSASQRADKAHSQHIHVQSALRE